VGTIKRLRECLERIDGGAAEEVIGPQRDGHRGVFQRVDAIDASKVGLSIACNCSREIVRGDALFVARPRKEMKSVAMLQVLAKNKTYKRRAGLRPETP